MQNYGFRTVKHHGRDAKSAACGERILAKMQVWIHASGAGGSFTCRTFFTALSEIRSVLSGTVALPKVVEKVGGSLGAGVKRGVVAADVVPKAGTRRGRWGRIGDWAS